MTRIRQPQEVNFVNGIYLLHNLFHVIVGVVGLVQFLL